MSENQTTHLSSLKDICRCCHSDGNFYSLKEPYKFKGKVEVYYRMLIETFGILISPPTLEVSYTICDDCILRLRDSTIFRNQVEACEEKFNQYSQIFFKPVDKNDADAETMVELKKEHNYFENVDDTVNVDDHVENVDNEDYENITVTKIEDGVSNVVEVQDDDVEESEGTNIEYELKNVNETDDISEKVENLKMKIEDKDDDLHNAENGVDLLKKHSSRLKNENIVGCVLCRKKFISKDLLKIHIKEHLNKKYKCTDCEHSFVCLSRLKIHSRTIHNKPISFEEDIKSVQDKKKIRVICRFCKKYVPESGYQSHLKKHVGGSECINRKTLNSKDLLKESFLKHPETKYTCDFCSQQFLRKDGIKSHMFVHMGVKKSTNCNSVVEAEFMRSHSCIEDKNGVENNILSNYLECRFCKKQVREYYYERHLKIHVRRTECINCGKIFDSTDLLKEHSKKHIYENMYTCDFCKKRFIVKSTLKRHIDLHHMGKGRKFMCHECGFFSNDITNLRAHTTSVHLKLRMFECSVCQKKLASKKTLKIHMRTHTGERPYVCDECDDGFTCFTKLKIHKIKHDIMKKHDSKYVCKICHKTFHGQRLLTHHVRSEHPGILPITSNKYKRKYLPCPSCNKVFSQKYSLDRHMTKHGDIVKVPCELCNKMLTDKSSLYRHIRNMHTSKEKVVKEKVQCLLCKRKVQDIENHMTVHTVRPMKCDTCGKNYPDAAILHRHVMNVHHDVNKIFQCNKCDRRPYSRRESLRSHMLKKHGCDVKAE